MGVPGPVGSSIPVLRRGDFDKFGSGKLGTFRLCSFSSATFKVRTGTHVTIIDAHFFRRAIIARKISA